jgi:hypothetical protein
MERLAKKSFETSSSLASPLLRTRTFGFHKAISFHSMIEKDK